MKPRILIVSPYLAEANNGNWRTADRWCRMLSAKFHAIVQASWSVQSAPCDLLIALHARRSHASVVAFCEAHPHKPIIVVLTGTDLYRDLPDDANAMESLRMANALVVLQDDAVRFLPKSQRAKARVIYQSSRLLAPAIRPTTFLKCVAVGHLRDEKSPQTVFEAFGLMAPEIPIRFDHIGAPLDATLARQARALAKRDPRYRYLGALPHTQTRQAIRRAHLLVHASRMEGGANVIVEAITSGTPVLASRMSGNIGMLGQTYDGYFRPGDAANLAKKLERCAYKPEVTQDWLTSLSPRRKRFAPESERNAIISLVLELLDRSR